VPLEPNEPVLDGDAIRDRVRDRVRLLDLVIEAERLRDTLLLAEGATRERERVELLETLLLAEGTTRERERVELLETLLLAEGTNRERERVELLETLAERLPDLLREA
jgi:hypothetical protein